MNEKERMNNENSDIRDSIDALMKKDPNLETMAEELAHVEPDVLVQPHDYNKSRLLAKGKAKKMMQSLLKFYVNNDFITNDEYIQAKIGANEETLAGLMFHLETADRAIVTLMRTIESGELHARMFEVLAALQKSYLDILKVKATFEISSEEHMKKLSADFEIYSNKAITEHVDVPIGTTATNIHRGTKKLMKELAADDELDADAFENGKEVPE